MDSIPTLNFVACENLKLFKRMRHLYVNLKICKLENHENMINSDNIHYINVLTKESACSPGGLLKTNVNLSLLLTNGGVEVNINHS